MSARLSGYLTCRLVALLYILRPNIKDPIYYEKFFPIPLPF